MTKTEPDYVEMGRRNYNAQEYINKKKKMKFKNNVSNLLWGIVYIIILYGILLTAR